MTKHLAPATESTRRALRTALQYVAAFSTFIVAVAIPPVGDAVNAVLSLLPFVTFEVTPALVTAVGLVGVALVSIATKIQNVIEGRDHLQTPTEMSEYVLDLVDEVNDLTAQLAAALAAAQNSSATGKDGV